MESVQFSQREEKPATPRREGDEFDVEVTDNTGASDDDDDDEGDYDEDSSGDGDFITFDDGLQFGAPDDDDEYEDGDDSEDNDPDDEDDTLDFNPNVFMAKSLKKEGVLGDDFEITDDITYDKVFTHVREKVVGKAIEEGRQQGLESILSKYTEEDLLFVSARRQGVDPLQFNTLERMRVYGGMDLTKASPEDKENLVKSMYVLRGTPADDAELLVQAKKAQIDTLATEAKNAHAAGFTQWRQSVEDREAAQEKARVDNENAALAKVNKVLTTRKVGSVEFTAEQAADLRRDLYEAYETFTHDGKSYPITPINKFLHEFQSNVDLQLELYMLHKNKDLLLKKTRDKAKDEVEEEMRKAASKATRAKSKPRSPKASRGFVDGVQFSV